MALFRAFAHCSRRQADGERVEQILQTRPMFLGDSYQTCALFAEKGEGRRPPTRGAEQGSRVDSWRNIGGKHAVLCETVPEQMLLDDSEKGLVVARRHGKIVRNDLPEDELRYRQYNISCEPRPQARAGLVRATVTPQPCLLPRSPLIYTPRGRPSPPWLSRSFRYSTT